MKQTMQQKRNPIIAWFVEQGYRFRYSNDVDYGKDVTLGETARRGYAFHLFREDLSVYFASNSFQISRNIPHKTAPWRKRRVPIAMGYYSQCTISNGHLFGARLMRQR